MKHIDRMIQQDPQLRQVDFVRLVKRAQEDPVGHWEELVRASAPVVYTAALRLAGRLPDTAALAEQATREVFEAIRNDDFAILRHYVGYGRWPSLLVRLTQRAPVLYSRRGPREASQAPREGRPPVVLDDPDGPIPELDPKLEEMVLQEGERLLTALWKVLRNLHRRDRLLLGMRYEQGLTLHELDHLFRLGTPKRVADLLHRLRHALQPFRAVVEAWKVPPEQEEALLRLIIAQIYRSRSMETAKEEQLAPAVQGR